MRLIADVFHLIEHLILKSLLPLFIKLKDQRSINFFKLIKNVKHDNREDRRTKHQDIARDHYAHHWKMQDHLKCSCEEQHVLDSSRKEKVQKQSDNKDPDQANSSCFSGCLERFGELGQRHLLKDLGVKSVIVRLQGNLVLTPKKRGGN